MRTPEDSFGSPFDLILRCSTQLEDGRSVGDSDNLLPLVAQIVAVLTDAGVGRGAEAVVNNELRVLDELTPLGEPTMLAAPAYLRVEFNRSRIARHFADQVIAQLGPRWAAPSNNGDGAARERRIASIHHMSGLDELMQALQHDEHGQAILGTFDRELQQSWKAKRPKPKDLPLNLHDTEGSFAERLHGASGKAQASATDMMDGYASAIDMEVRKAVDQAGLGVAGDIVNGAAGRVAGMESTILEQRDALKEALVEAEAKATAAFESLVEAVEHIRTGWLKGINGPLKPYLEAATIAFGLRFALGLTEAALGALGRARGVVRDLASEVDSERHILQLFGERCTKRVEDLESRVITPIEQLTERPLYDVEELHALYGETAGTGWESVTEEMADAIWHRLGGLARFLGLDEGVVYDQLVAATLPSFERVAAMTADDFIRWKYQRLGRAADLFLRDCDLAAPVLCRVDRARLPSGSRMRETSFFIIGVPDRDRSVFFGTPHGLLVTTGDPNHIVFLKIKLGFPASALWQYERYYAAHEEVARAGRVAQGIYPGFPHELWRQWIGQQANGGKARPRGQAAQRRRQRS